MGTLAPGVLKVTVEYAKDLKNTSLIGIGVGKQVRHQASGPSRAATERGRACMSGYPGEGD